MKNPITSSFSALTLSVFLLLTHHNVLAKEYHLESGSKFNLTGKYKDSEFITNNRALKKISRETAGRATTIEAFLGNDQFEVHFFNENVGYFQPENCEIDKDELFGLIEKQTTIQSKETNRSIKPVRWVIEPKIDNELDAIYYAFEAQFDDNPSNTWVNYRIYELGRYGYEKMQVVVSPEGFLSLDATEILTYLDDNHNFEDGANYSDYQEGDPLAPYGTCGLLGSFFGALEDADLGMDEISDTPSLNIFWVILLILATVGATIFFNRRNS